MREFDLGRRFSLIFVARNSLLHLSEQDEFAAFFSSVRRHLEPDGVLAFDIFNPSLQLLSRPSGERFHVMRAISPLHGELTVEMTNDYDRHSQVNRALGSFLRRKNAMPGLSRSTCGPFFPRSCSPFSR